MRYLVDIHHPKHAHFFRPLVRHWLAHGDAVAVVSRDKDITLRLLELFGIPNQCLSRQKKGLGLAGELLARWARCAGAIHRFRPDVTLSVAGVTTAPPSCFMRVPTIAITDTETATLSNRIAFPFADAVVTPRWYMRDHGSRHVRFDSFLEWSYLCPEEFVPNKDIVRAEGLDPDEPYALVRLVRWNAAHDARQAGFSERDTVRLVRGLAQCMRVCLTSEAAPPPELAEFQIRVRVDRIHHIMAFARLVVGESPSMSTEAALLGVPAVLASTWAGGCGNMQVLEGRFGLMRVFRRGGPAVDAALAWAEAAPSRQDILAARERLVRELEPIPSVVARFVAQVTEGRRRP